VNELAWEIIKYVGAASGMALFCWLTRSWWRDDAAPEAPGTSRNPTDLMAEAEELEVPVDPAKAISRQHLERARKAPDATLRAVRFWLHQESSPENTPHA